MDKHAWKEKYLAVRKRPSMYFGDIEHASTEYGKSLLKFIISCQKDRLKTIDLYLSPQGTHEVKSNGIDFTRVANSRYDDFEIISIAAGSLWCAFRMPDNTVKFYGPKNPPYFIMDVKNWDDDTVFRAQLDPEIFNTEFVSIFPLQGAARALAIAKPGLSVRLSQDGYTTQHCYPNGASDRLMEKDCDVFSGTPYLPIRLQTGDTQNYLDMAFRTTNSCNDSQFETYINGALLENKYTDSGTHIKEFLQQLKKRNDYSSKAIFSFWLTMPVLKGACRNIFDDKYGIDLVKTAMQDKLPITIAKRPELVDIFGNTDYSSNDND